MTQRMKIVRNHYSISGLLLVAALGFTGTAHADDISTDKSDATTAMLMHDDWLSPYAGLTLGYLGSGMDIGRGAGKSDLELRDGSLGVGAIVGYNFASFGETGTSRWLMGAEADLTGTPRGKKETDPTLGTVNTDATWLGSLRLRSGFATEQLFLYGTAGVGFSNIDIHAAGQSDRDKLRAGLVFGLGAEMTLNENWTTRVEGLAYGFGKDEETIAGASRDINSGFVTARFGIARRF